jgi:hypothetical protein
MNVEIGGNGWAFEEFDWNDTSSTLYSIESPVFTPGKYAGIELVADTLFARRIMAAKNERETRKSTEQYRLIIIWTAHARAYCLI